MTRITFNSILVYSFERQDRQFSNFNNNLNRLQSDTEIVFSSVHIVQDIELTDIILEVDQILFCLYKYRIVML